MIALKSPVIPGSASLAGKRAAMVMFSSYPADPRPRRAVELLVGEGMQLDLICLGDESEPQRETLNGIRMLRIPITHKRAGKASYIYNYAAFILAATTVLAARSMKRRYDLVYVHNMPDVLVVCSLIPKTLGAKVILDLHDPMPELMTTIYQLDKTSFSLRLMKRLEKWSISRANLVITVNETCKRIFASRSCSAEKIGVVMKSFLR